MAKSMKSHASGLGEGQLLATIKESAEQIWLAGLGAFAKAQTEGGKVFDALVKEGEALQSRSRQVATERIAEMAEKASGTWDKLEQVFEDRVARTLNRLGVPSKKEIDALTRRVAELTALVAKMDGKGKAHKAETAASTAAKKPAAKRAAVARSH